MIRLLQDMTAGQAAAALVFLALVLAVGVMSCRDYWDEP